MDDRRNQNYMTWCDYFTRNLLCLTELYIKSRLIWKVDLIIEKSRNVCDSTNQSTKYYTGCYKFDALALLSQKL